MKNYQIAGEEKLLKVRHTSANVPKRELRGSTHLHFKWASKNGRIFEHETTRQVLLPCSFPESINMTGMRYNRL